MSSGVDRCTVAEHNALRDSDEAWAKLARKADWVFEEETLEQRDCPRCGSTLARSVLHEKAEMPPNIVQLRPLDRRILKEAYECHDAALVDLQDAIDMYEKAGDDKMAKHVTKHLGALKALRMLGSP